MGGRVSGGKWPKQAEESTRKITPPALLLINKAHIEMGRIKIQVDLDWMAGANIGASGKRNVDLVQYVLGPFCYPCLRAGHGRFGSPATIRKKVYSSVGLRPMLRCVLNAN
jgi:hypothetical protein